MIKCGSRALFKFYFSWFVLISFIIFFMASIEKIVL